MLMDGGGGIGGVWFESVKVVMGKGASAPSAFLSYNQWPCDPGSPCPNVTGDIRGNIEVEWQASKGQCTPRLMSDGAAPADGVVFGLELLKNVSVGCSKHN
jgi:hypothetical protein